jgi:1,2-dihydroxy-3-keto-5-methylthiopentene dioxygenase
VQLEHWPLKLEGNTRKFLEKEALLEEEKQGLLLELEHVFKKLKKQEGYQDRDLVVLHPKLENLNKMLSKFYACHTHDDDEVRYIIDGEGVFGFVLPDGHQVELVVAQGDFIRVPKNTEHWFYLTDSMRIKAVRYFTGTEGWVPVYTNTPIRMQGLS